jgi:hypothetical protein
MPDTFYTPFTLSASQPSHTHVYTWTITKEPTESADGTATGVCFCGVSYGSTIAVPKRSDYYGTWAYGGYTLTIDASSIRFEDSGFSTVSWVEYSDVVWTAVPNKNTPYYSKDYPSGFSFTGTRTASDTFYDSSVGLGFFAISADKQTLYAGQTDTIALSRTIWSKP